MARDRKLKPEERILWGLVAKTTRAMPGRMEELIEFEIEFTLEPQAPLPATPAGTARGAQGAGSVDMNAADKLAPPAKKHHPLEKPVKRKLSRGRLPLEARIDLHGLIQSEAHSILLDFLMRAHDRGLRHVLIITGKGSSMGSEGALKRAVPLWFAKPQFRYLISSYEPAAQHHGGEGAMYVRLARRGDERS